MTHKELCGHPTPNGPCNMKKGHPAPFHRNRQYRTALSWIIKDGNESQIIESGKGRVELGYALTRNLDKYNNLIIEIAR